MKQQINNQRNATFISSHNCNYNYVSCDIGFYISIIHSNNNFVLSNKKLATKRDYFVFPSLVLSEVKGGKGDVKPIQIYRTKVIPGIKDYYDILSVSVMKINNKLSFVMDLSGDPNKNEKYETTYIWLIYYNTSSFNRNSASQNEQIYTLLIPNFAPDSNFSLKGWYTAIFNNTANTYNLPLTRISEMPKDKVGVDIDPSLIGNPASFNYMTCVMVRVNSTFLNKPPDYLMDSVPRNDRFWEGWWAR